MPMFFFHILQADGVTTTDDIGSEFASAQAAREEATRALHEMAMDVRPDSGITAIEIHVKDEAGRTIARRAAHFEAEDMEF
jgi:hypothetical protein